ncbi:MAG: methylated-DNA--[protein]-cysteine S-methyltransferase [Candidatus Krumholzibacteriia bacterium]
MTHCHATTMSSPVGLLYLGALEGRLTHVLYESNGGPALLEAALPGPPDPVLVTAERQLTEYFAHLRRTFDLPLASAGTPFQKEVRRELLRIPYGSAITYGDLAGRIGKPSAVRAVGAANGRNPLSIVVPCHRVIGAGGDLTGYGGGLEAKARLLALEGVQGDRVG